MIDTGFRRQNTPSREVTSNFGMHSSNVEISSVLAVGRVSFDLQQNFGLSNGLPLRLKISLTEAHPLSGFTISMLLALEQYSHMRFP